MWILLLVTALSASAETLRWTAAARTLSAGPAARTKALEELKSSAGLNGVLRAALETDNKFLALDVITALDAKALLPDLLRLSADEPSGFFYLTTNTLADSSTIQQIARVYMQRLEDRRTSAAARAILLESLARMQVALHPRVLERYLWRDPSPEVANAAIYYLRRRLIAHRDLSYLPVLQRALERSTSLQRGVQLRALADELRGQ